MRDLEMETAVEELDFGGTDHIHRRPQLTRGEGFRWTQIFRRASEM